MEAEVSQVCPPVWLGEGPHWDAAEQALYFVSIFDRSIHKYHPATGLTTSAKLDGMPTFIIPVADKPAHFVVGLDNCVVEVRWEGGEGDGAGDEGDAGDARVVRRLAEVDTHLPGVTRFNDAKADPRGRLFAGTMSHEYEPGKFHPKKGSLYRLSPSGEATRLASDIDISNGLAWDVAEKAFYYADSFEYAIRRYDYDVDTGDISNPRIVFKYADHGLPGIVDGMTIDTDGNLWVANFDGSQILKIDPRTSTLLGRVSMPTRQVTSVTWGGPALDQLFATTAAIDRGEPPAPPAGATFRLQGLGARGYQNNSVVLQ